MKIRTLAVVAAILFMPGFTLADHHGGKSDTGRVGNCEDAKKQMAYFCDESNAGSDSMTAPIQMPSTSSTTRLPERMLRF